MGHRKAKNYDYGSYNKRFAAPATLLLPDFNDFLVSQV
jgi:hypothetical protein